MTTKTIHSGHTLTVPLALAGTASLIVQGAYPGLGPGTAILSGTGTLAPGHFILAIGGLPAYAGAAPRAGGTVTLGGMLANLGTIDIGGGQPGAYAPGGREAGGAGAVFTDRGVLTNSSLILVQGAVTNGPFTTGVGGTLAVAGVLLNTGTIALDVGSPRLPGIQGAEGGVLLDNGSLTNDGLISLQAVVPGSLAFPTYQSALVSVATAGTLTNAGTIQLAGGTGATAQYQRGSYGAGIGCNGVLINTGLIAFAGGGPGRAQSNGSFYGGGGAGMTMGGMLTNAGTITLGGGGGGTAAEPGGGSGARVDTLLYTTLTNSGVITIGGGNGGAAPGAYGGGGALLDAYGDLTNTGLIDCQAGRNPAASGAHAGSDAVIYVGEEYRGGVLTNAGTILLNTNTQYPQPYETFDMVVENELLLTGAGNVTGTGTILNFGTIAGAGIITGGGLINDGTVIAGAGLLAINEQISGNGDFTVAAGATLSLAGSVSMYVSGTFQQGQSVALDPAGVLDLTSGTAGVAILTQGGTVTLLGGGAAKLYAADTNLTVDLAQATTLTLGRAGFVTAIGSTGNDTLIALAAGQTLTGRLGADTLIGAAANGDTFADTAAGLNTDTIGGFAGADVIDLTDLAPGPALSLAYAQNGAAGTLTLREGAQSTTITLLGAFALTDFTTTPDSHGGTLIGLQP